MSIVVQWLEWQREREQDKSFIQMSGATARVPPSTDSPTAFRPKGLIFASAYKNYHLTNENFGQNSKVEAEAQGHMLGTLRRYSGWRWCWPAWHSLQSYSGKVCILQGQLVFFTHQKWNLGKHNSDLWSANPVLVTTSKVDKIKQVLLWTVQSWNLISEASMYFNSLSALCKAVWFFPESSASEDKDT